jgi:hypothetical protein
MRHDDICIITRTTSEKDPVTHIVNKPNQPTTLQPFNCRLGRTSGTLTQRTPQGTFVQQQRIYIPNTAADIQEGDIATITVKNKDGSTRTGKYIVGNIYYPNNHHIEADATYKGEA